MTHCLLTDIGFQSREAGRPPRHAMAHAGASLDEGDEGQASEHGSVLEDGLGLAGLRQGRELDENGSTSLGRAEESRQEETRRISITPLSGSAPVPWALPGSPRDVWSVDAWGIASA